MAIDLIEILGNLSRSIYPIQNLLSGLSYILGIVCTIIAIGKFKKIGDYRARGGSNEKMFIPTVYLLFGVALIFLPTSISVLSNTAFGINNALQYTEYDPYDIYSIMVLLIRTAGLLWFIRGSILLVHASEPGVQEGPKGFVFLVAGIFAMNIEGTMGWIEFIVEYFLAMLPAAPSQN